jgi:hypothetical protein
MHSSLSSACYPIDEACQTQCLLSAALKRGDCSGARHMGEENHNHLLVLIPSLNLGYNFIYFFLFSHKHTQIWISLKHIFTIFNWSIKQQYTSSYLTCIWNLLKLGHFGPHVVFNLRIESGCIQHQREPHVTRGPQVWHACCKPNNTVCKKYKGWKGGKIQEREETRHLVMCTHVNDPSSTLC